MQATPRIQPMLVDMAAAALKHASLVVLLASEKRKLVRPKQTVVFISYVKEIKDIKISYKQ